MPRSGWQTILIVLIAIATLVVAILVGLKVWRMFGGSVGQKVVTLTYWGLWEPKEVVDPIIAEFEKTHPKIKVNYVFQSQREYRERLQNALSSGRGPDIFRFHNTWVPMLRADLAIVPDMEKVFYPVVDSDLRTGSNYIGVPLMFDGLAMFVNNQLLAEAGEEVPKGWVDDIPRIARAATKKVDDRILQAGVALGTADNVDHWEDVLALLMLQNNVNLSDPTGKAAEDVLSYYTQFVREERLWSSDLPNSSRLFAEGKLAIYFAPAWRALELPSSLDYSVHPMPQLPLDSTRGEQPTYWASYWVEGVNKKSVDQTAAWEFIHYLSSAETLQKFYAAAVASGRAFGEIYPRTDLATNLAQAPVAKTYVQQAPLAKSWYLASATWDGPTGINSKLAKYFADAINSVNAGRGVSEAVQTLRLGVNQVLSQYGLAAPIPETNR